MSIDSSLKTQLLDRITLKAELRAKRMRKFSILEMGIRLSSEGPYADLSEIVNVKAGPKLRLKPGAFGGHNLIGIGHSEDLG